MDWDEAERQLEAARDRAGSTVGERLELVAASIALGRYRYTEAERVARAVAARAAARGDDRPLARPGCSPARAQPQRTCSGPRQSSLGRWHWPNTGRWQRCERGPWLRLAAWTCCASARAERVALAREAALDAGMAALAAASTHDLAMLGVLRFELDDARAWAEQTVLLGTPLPARVGARRRTDQGRMGRRPYGQL